MQTDREMLGRTITSKVFHVTKVVKLQRCEQTREKSARKRVESLALALLAPKLNTKGATHADLRVARAQEKLGISITFRVGH